MSRKATASSDTPRRVVCVMPSWLGDVVMATPTLRALRRRFPEAELSAWVRPAFRAVLAPCPWVDRILPAQSSQRHAAAALRRRAVDMAVLLPNSMRVGLLAWWIGARRRVGYLRDGRGPLLTDRLIPRHDAAGRWVPMPAREYFLTIARYLGAEDEGPMELHTRPSHDARAEQLLARRGHEACRPLVIMVPGASYGSAKRWPASRFAALADRMREKHGATVALAGAPTEQPVLDRVKAAASSPLWDLPAEGVALGLVKSLIGRASLVVTNDTGPRHVAAALGTPVLTLFGPTDPAWTEIDFPWERQMRVPVPCGPCQRKVCPLDQRCLRRIHPEAVLEEAEELGLGGGKVVPVEKH